MSVDLGIVETTIAEDEDAKLRRVGSGTSGPGGPKGGRGPGGGGPGGDDDVEDPIEQARSRSRILTWFVLLVVLMTFGGVFAAYVVLATNRSVEWSPFNLPFQVWVSTAILLAGSICYFQFERYILNYDHRLARAWFIFTAMAGVAFIVSQVVVWFELSAQGIYASGNPYAGFFYILTALHAVHVIGGMIALAGLYRRCLTPPIDEASRERQVTLSSTVGWYWHFMGILWLIIVLLLSFWR